MCMHIYKKKFLDWESGWLKGVIFYLFFLQKIPNF